MNKRPAYNPNLLFIKDNWTGNHLSVEGLYENLDGTSVKPFGDAWKWMSGKRPLAKLKKNQKSTLSFTKTTSISDKSFDSIIPLGHAGFVIDVNGTRIVIDPMMSAAPLLKRYTPLPFRPEELTGIDYLLLSHNHRDHIDKATIRLLTLLNPDCKILTGLETGKLLSRWKVKNEIEEAGWFQRYLTKPAVVIDYLPAKHWSRRWLNDTNINLWGSYMLQFPGLNKNVYFGSDSGYGQHFEIIGQMYEIDLAILGIGAFEPQWFMSSGHTGPIDAVKAFRDLKAKSLMPMHYGTFDLGDEPVYYPEQILREIIKEDPIDIRWMEVGTKMEL